MSDSVCFIAKPHGSQKKFCEGSLRRFLKIPPAAFLRIITAADQAPSCKKSAIQRQIQFYCIIMILLYIYVLLNKTKYLLCFIAACFLVIFCYSDLMFSCSSALRLFGSSGERVEVYQKSGCFIIHSNLIWFKVQSIIY